jgi:hypothetical protein
MKKIVFLALACILSFGFNAETFAQGKEKKAVKLSGKKMEKSRGADPNIKQDRPTTDVVQEKTRGLCSVDFINYTGYTINVYVDGYFKGTLSPYGSGNVTVGSGYTRIYCVTAGGTYSWTATGNCDHAYQYSLSVSNAN